MNQIKLNKLKENFKLRNIEVSYFETLDEAKQHILNNVPHDCSIGIGHSATLQKMNITNSLINRGNTVDEAIKRAKNVAAPLNARRAGYNPPCVTLNKCVDCVSEERVCNSLSIIEGQSDCSRIKLFIVNDECGF